jgi:hypothetical protein
MIIVSFVVVLGASSVSNGTRTGCLGASEFVERNVSLGLWGAAIQMNRVSKHTTGNRTNH